MTQPKPAEYDDNQVDVAELRELVKQNTLFSLMSDEQLQHLMGIITGMWHLDPGDYVVHEGDEADNIYIIRSGSYEVLKKEFDSDTVYPIAKLGPGMSIGEVALLDSGKRSASVRALQPGTLLVIPIEKLNALSQAEESVDIRMKMNLAYEMGRRLRDTNESSVRYLQERLSEAEKRVEMGKFLTRVLVGLALYMFTMGFTAALAKVIDTTWVTIPILAGFAFGVYRTVVTSPYPKANYGFTLANWQHNIVDSILWTIPMLAAIAFLKFLAVMFMPDTAGTTVFELSRNTGLTLTDILILSGAYAAFCPVQEMIARSGIQCSCQMFLTGKYRILQSIVLSNLLFSATHLHVGLSMALFVLPAGFFWGWLFSRQGSILGTSISHAIIGIYAFFIIGFDFIIG